MVNTKNRMSYELNGNLYEIISSARRKFDLEIADKENTVKMLPLPDIVEKISIWCIKTYNIHIWTK